MSTETSHASDHKPCRRPRVGLFVTCLVDLFRPNIGFATISLLEQAGCSVVVPTEQVCCGQPAYNSGDTHQAHAIARQVIAAFQDVDYLVAPSGSCIGMIKHHYPGLFVTDATWHSKAQALAERSFEIMSFLHDVIGFVPTVPDFDETVTYHDSCSGLRELGIQAQPRRLLAKVPGLVLTEMPDAEACCGFGGTFCVKYPPISARLVDNKLASIKATKASTVLGGDLGCLLNIAGRLRRREAPVRVFHAVEVIAGMTDIGGLGQDKNNDQGSES